MTPREVVTAWVAAFNRADVDALAALYAEDAVNHQVAYGPREGRAAIRAMMAADFERAEMTNIVETMVCEGEWAVLEWSDPAGLRGCDCFQVKDGLIVLQRGYFDRSQFYRLQGIPIEEEPA